MNSRPGRIDRRTFTRSLTAATLLTGLPAPFVHASSKSGRRPVIVGQGEYRYECQHDWAMDNLPDGATYGNASHGVTIDRQGRIYISHQGRPGSVFVFDPDGTFVRSMGDFHSRGKGDQARASGHGIDLREENGQEFIYLAASDSEFDFVKMDLNGEIVWRIDRNRLNQDSHRYAPQAPYRPTNTSFSPDGGFFLGDGYGSNLIHQYDANQQYLRTVGETGQGDGQFRTPHGQWLDDRDGTPKLVVADRANARLQWFDMQGNYLKQLGGFLFPADIDIQGEIMLVPDLHCRITLLDGDNRVLTHLGDDPDWRKRALEGFKMRTRRDQWVAGKFVHPHDACFDREGNIFVTEWVQTGRVTKLKKVD